MLTLPPLDKVICKYCADGCHGGGGGVDGGGYGGSSSSSSSSSQRNDLATAWRNRSSNPNRGKRLSLGPNQPFFKEYWGFSHG